MAVIEQENSPLLVELAKSVRLIDDITALFNGAKNGDTQEGTVFREIIDGLNSARHYCLQKVPSIVFLEPDITSPTPLTKRVITADKTPQQEESIQDYMKRIGFEPGRVFDWEIKQHMILEALARHNRARFESELRRISDLQKGGEFFKDFPPNRIIEIAAMATFAKTGSGKKTEIEVQHRTHRNGSGSDNQTGYPHTPILETPISDVEIMVGEPSQHQESTKSYMKRIGFDLELVHMWGTMEDAIIHSFSPQKRATFEEECKRIHLLQMEGKLPRVKTQQQILEIAAIATYGRKGKSF